MYLLLLSWIVFLSVWSPTFCSGERVPDAVLNGSSVTAIPTGMEPADMTFLRIFKTNIQTLDLRQLLSYTSLDFLEVKSSPVIQVVSAHLPALLHLHLNSLNMAVPPDLGPLSPQLEGLGFADSNIASFPGNYFTNFTRLKGLGLNNLGLTNLPDTWLRDLSKIREIYISGNPLEFLPPLQEWFPYLKGVYAKCIGLTSIPVTLIKEISSPGVLMLKDNKIIEVPQRDEFEPIEKWQQINLKGNQLHCDESICWIKVRWGNLTVDASLALYVLISKTSWQL